MLKTRLIQSVCAVGLLAAAPAFAQTNTQTGATGVGGTPNNPTAAPYGSGTAMPADRMGSPHDAMGGTGSHAAMDHRSARHGHHMRGAHDTPHDNMADQLNEQSYQAAQSGRAYTGPAHSDMMGSGGSGSMHDMPGGSMSHGGTMK